MPKKILHLINLANSDNTTTTKNYDPYTDTEEYTAYCSQIRVSTDGRIFLNNDSAPTYFNHIYIVGEYSRMNVLISLMEKRASVIYDYDELSDTISSPSYSSDPRSPTGPAYDAVDQASVTKATRLPTGPLRCELNLRFAQLTPWLSKLISPTKTTNPANIR